MKTKVRKYRNIIVILCLLSIFYIYSYIDKQMEASFTDQDFSAFSEMKNIFQNMTQEILRNNPDCEIDSISFILQHNNIIPNNSKFRTYLHCKNGLRSEDINNENPKLAKMLSTYKIMWISLSKNSSNNLENIFFSKQIDVRYTSNIYNENECDVKVIEDITTIPDEKIEVCKMYCQKLKYQNWYLCKTIEESKALF